MNKYHRVLLKISGEALAGAEGFGINPKVLLSIAQQIKDVHDLGIEVAVVIGGGNFWRGITAVTDRRMDRVSADGCGMLATVINAIAMQDGLEGLGVQTRVMTAFRMESLAELYIRRRAIRHLEKRRIILLAAGTGHAYFSTDTAAALRAAEIGADIIFKATKVDGIYDSDPVENPEAVRFDRISYVDILSRGLRVMDSTATSMAMDNRIPIVVFNLGTDGNLVRAAKGETVGTLVHL